MHISLCCCVVDCVCVALRCSTYVFVQVSLRCWVREFVHALVRCHGRDVVGVALRCCMVEVVHVALRCWCCLPRFVHDAGEDAMRGLMTVVVALLQLAPNGQIEAGAQQQQGQER